MNFHSVIRAVALCSTVLCFSNTASAQQFPSKPIKLLVGFSAGGGTDAVARVYAQKLQEILKTPVVVDHRPGAFEAIAAQALTSAPPDGYTIWLATTMALVTG